MVWPRNGEHLPPFARGSVHGRQSRLNLIHTNKSPKPVTAGLPGRSRLREKVLFAVGLVGGELELFRTLPEAMARRDELFRSHPGNLVAVLRLRTGRGADGETT